MKMNLELEEARSLLLEHVKSPPREETVSLLDGLNRILSRDVISLVNVPSFRRAAVDGYAMTREDMDRLCSEQVVGLKVIERVRAGFMPQHQVLSGCVVKTMTGAPVPEGTDAVVKYEFFIEDDDCIYLKNPIAKEQKKNVADIGEDVKEGEIIGREGSLITPAMIGIMAASGHSEIWVRERIKAAIISTGDEVVDFNEDLSNAKIYNSNLFCLAALCQNEGAVPVLQGNAPDHVEQIAEKISEGLSHADLVITTGGVSVGDYDVVKEALSAIDAKILFWKVRMKPGRPALAAVKDNKLILGLSGNPGAAMISFELLVKPLLRKLTGQKMCRDSSIKATLAQSFPKSSPQRRFLRGRLGFSANGVEVILTGEQNSGVLKSMVGCNVLVDIPAGSGPLTAGREVSVRIAERIDNF